MERKLNALRSAGGAFPKRKCSGAAPWALDATVASMLNPLLGKQKSGLALVKSTGISYFLSTACRYSSQKLELNVIWNSVTNLPSRSINPCAQSFNTSSVNPLPMRKRFLKFG
ncbi:hypothetical protein D3C81_1836870 [compost metagenome]